MFKRPIKVELDSDNISVDHKVTVHPLIAFQAERLIKISGKTAIAVIAVAAVASTSSEIITHTAKTKIK